MDGTITKKNLMKNNKKKIIVLTPVYNEEDSLHRYIEVVSDVLFQNKDYNFSILFIDDGSVDSSWELICEFSRKEPLLFQGIRLSRNFGSHTAIAAGLEQIENYDAVVILACDLQDPPETILFFLKKWEQGASIVWGKRQSLDDSPWRIVTSQIFSWLMRRFAMPKDSKFTTGSFFLIDKKVAFALSKFNERNRITFALVAWTGFKQDIVLYDRRKRQSGSSGWSFSKMLKTMYDALLGFAHFPVRLITYLGLAAFLISVLLTIYLIISKVMGNPVLGWTGIMISMSFFFGLQFFITGIVGEYLYRIYTEVTRRPLYFISDET